MFVSSEGQYDARKKTRPASRVAFRTAAPLPHKKYAPNDDKKRLSPPYQVTLLTRKEAADRLGDAGMKVIVDVQKPLTEEVMQELNSRVAIDKQEPAAVAKQYLQESGFIK